MTAAVALTVAGSDPSGGAGIQADLKTFSALGVYGTAVLTALTAQNTRGVTGVHPVPAEFVGLQLRALLDDVRVDATKLGMLGTAEVVREVARILSERRPGPVVCDPVMVATSGDRLIDEDAVAAVRTELLPITDLVTPNVPEAAALLDVAPASDVDELVAQATALLELGPGAVLLKGGHLGGTESADVLATAR
ncbi:MAG: bifunctional hydroxymethylpyrimidine kinase/phosphomethylpyrimidine kinase, partial [Actinomycetes bacterium]